MQMTVRHTTVTVRNLLRTLFLVCVNCNFQKKKKTSRGRKVEPNLVLNDNKTQSRGYSNTPWPYLRLLGSGTAVCPFRRKNASETEPPHRPHHNLHAGTQDAITPSLHDDILGGQCSGVVRQASTYRRTRSLSGVFW